MQDKNSYEYQEIIRNPYCMGFYELKNNCRNYSIISIDPEKDVLTNEYLAGVVQGELQSAGLIRASRNNTWNNTYLCDPTHHFPKNREPTETELKKAADCLRTNYTYLYAWLCRKQGERIAENIKRLLLRMYGIYRGQKGDAPESADFQALSPEALGEEAFILAYGETPLTFLDIYFINAQMDMFDAISGSLETTYGLHKPDHCSAFLKRTEDDIFWTHNSWCGFLSQSHTLTYLIRNGETKDFITQNSYCQGQFGSNMDFGFNGQGICFNETTHRYSYNQPQTEGIWLCWRAAAAEMFAGDIDDFCQHIMADNTGTYLNGYALIDVNTGETALLEMSYKTFALFRSHGGDYTLTEYRTDESGKQQKTNMSADDYNPDLLSKEAIFGVNFPVDYTVSNELLSRDNRPKRRIQFRNEIGKVKDMETAKALITYVEENEPLSVYGRWDLGHGNAGGYGKTIPDGAVDSKAFSAKAVKALLDSLQFKPNRESEKTSFWMLYGTAKINGKPFIWSESPWKDANKNPEETFVPDRLEGEWTAIRIFID